MQNTLANNARPALFSTTTATYVLCLLRAGRAQCSADSCGEGFVHLKMNAWERCMDATCPASECCGISVANISEYNKRTCGAAGFRSFGDETGMCFVTTS